MERLNLAATGLWVGVLVASTAACADHLEEVRSVSHVPRAMVQNQIDTEAFREPLADLVALTLWGSRTVLAADRDRVNSIDEQTGEVNGAFGRSGDGPGEFRQIAWVSVIAGDTLVVYDGHSRHQRLTYVTPKLALSRTSTIERLSLSENISPRCMLSTGELVVVASRRPRTPPSDGLRDATGTLRVYDRQLRNWVDAGNVTEEVRWVGSKESDRGPIRVSVPVPFSPALAIRCAGNTLYWGDGSTGSIRRYREGVVDVIGLRGSTAEPVTPADREAAADSARRAGGDAARRVLENAINARAYSSTPHYRDIRIGADGSIWTLAYRAAAHSMKVWHVYDERGGFKREVAVPMSFQLRAISSQRLWGIAWGADDAPAILSYSR